ncbi:MAG: hypothetical protein LBO62_05715 [Endomicrobium sp.]|nr:hypothetical protein [Endomicrobium sp.]
MKKLLGGFAAFCFIFIFSIAVFSQAPFKANSSAQSDNITQAELTALQTLLPGDALIKKADKKAVIDVLVIDYRPLKSGVLQVDIYDSKNILLASQTENVKKINEIATACIYVDKSADTQAITVVLNGAGFENKQISYIEN